VSKNESIHYRGRFLGLKETDRWEYAFRTNATGVVVLVPVTDAGELVLVEQYRIPVESRVMELPAGLSGDTGDRDEELKTAAQRELIEETGYRAGFLEELLTSPSTPGMSDEIVTIYYASGLERVGPAVVMTMRILPFTMCRLKTQANGWKSEWRKVLWWTPKSMPGYSGLECDLDGLSASDRDTRRCRYDRQGKHDR
jgi:8-oxo-dGTP pyrophosphatase MutT (NUDIX family)